MNRQVIKVFLFVSVLALWVSACDIPDGAGSEADRARIEELLAGAQKEELLAGAQIEELLTSAQIEELLASAQIQLRPTSEVNADQATTVESSQTSQAAALVVETISEVDPEDIPSLEEREAMLDRVNRGGLVFPESDQAPVSEGPAPGTESVIQGAPVQADASRAVDPDDIPSLEEREAMLDRVNRSGLVFPESDQAPVGEGPSPGTESVIGTESTSSTAEEASFPPLSQFIDMLRNWLQEVLNL